MIILYCTCRSFLVWMFLSYLLKIYTSSPWTSIAIKLWRYVLSLRRIPGGFQLLREAPPWREVGMHYIMHLVNTILFLLLTFSSGYHTANSVILNGEEHMLVFGGLHRRAPTNSMEVYNIGKNMWTTEGFAAIILIAFRRSTFLKCWFLRIDLLGVTGRPPSPRFGHTRFWNLIYTYTFPLSCYCWLVATVLVCMIFVRIHSSLLAEAMGTTFGEMAES